MAGPGGAGHPLVAPGAVRPTGVLACPLFLADLLRAQGALEQACRSWRVVLQQAAAPEAETGIRYLPLALSVQEARGVCERLLAQHAGVVGATGPAGQG